ncbi:MAG: hypothetical protein M1136_01125 [Chloroflexi bacterium]|nr:hypothetical protein [Chloroflexota bacterium]
MPMPPKVSSQWLSLLHLSLAVLLGLALLIGYMSLSGESTSSQAAPSLAFHGFTAPSGTEKVAEGEDYASLVWGDPWDMSQITDIYNERTLNMSSGAGTNRLEIVEGSILSGTTTTNDPQIFLLWPGYAKYQTVDKYGSLHPIDASKYKQLSFRMYLSQADPNTSGARLFWYGSTKLQDGPYTGSNVIPVYPGWHIYTIDLSAIGKSEGNLDWTGQIVGLRLTPVMASGVDVRIDWVRLTPLDTDSTTFNIQWTAGSGVASLYADSDTDDTATLEQITTGLDVSHTTSYTWKTAHLPPGNYYVAARVGIDYASTVLEKPWNMSDAGDVAFSVGLDPLTFSDGVLRAKVTKSAGDNYFWLRYDVNRPIDKTVFKKLVFRMYSSQPSKWLFLWYDVDDTSHPYFGNWQDSQTGWQTYSLDLSEDPHWTDPKATVAKILRLTPAYDVGVEVQIDWVALTTGDTPSSESDLALTTIYSPGPLAVNKAPVLRFTAPSMTSGEDYATAHFGKPWDMNSLCDIAATHDLASYSLNEGILNLTSTGTVYEEGNLKTGDPQVTLRTSAFPGAPTIPIDTDKYYYVTYRFKEDHAQDTDLGSINRLVWWNRGASLDMTEAEAVVTDEGWHTYSYDLKKALIASGPGWTGTQTVFRFDPNEIPKAVTSHLDYVLLTADDWADTSYTIRWSIANPDDTAMITLYYDTSNTAYSEEHQIASISQSAGDSYTWDTSAVAPGTYYIWAKVNDGHNIVRRYSETPLIISRWPTVNITQPDGTDDRLLLGRDYATNVLGNPWDMDSPADAPLISGISDSFSAGVFSGRGTNDDPYFWLNTSDSTGKVAYIDAATYSRLTFRMYADQNTRGAVFWSPAEGVWYSTEVFTIYPGWNQYSLDLSTYPRWTGLIRNLRLDPVSGAGVNFQVDWVKLTAPSSSNFTIRWSASNDSNASLSLYYDTRQGSQEGILIASGLNPASGSYTWDTSFLDLGTYYVYAKISSKTAPTRYSYAPGPITIVGQTPPSLQVWPNALGIWTLGARITEVSSTVSQTLTIDSGGVAAFSWTAATDQPWLAVSPSSGSAQPAVLTVTADRSGKTVGSYSGQVMINAGQLGTRTIPITLVVAQTINKTYLPLSVKSYSEAW